MLQVKQAQRSVLADYVPGHEYAGQGGRLIEGSAGHGGRQRSVPSAPSPAVTSTIICDYYVRQLRDGKGSGGRGRAGA